VVLTTPCLVAMAMTNFMLIAMTFSLAMQVMMNFLQDLVATL
jgi:hypothetical protein